MPVLNDGAESARSLLPLLVERPIRLWEYHVSHRTLVMRGRSGDDDPSAYVEVVFTDVLGMKLRSYSYSSLEIREANTGTEMADFVPVPERHRERYLNLVVSGDGAEGFVVCANVHLREGR
ncbi:hypothetical protein SRB5_47650 [Streptomyces sp. RB5]|uniref:Uncharacterized protein n=1 Tax=Streptomyces smaragdinus TaxID=2585196 RepID=A0A7K0CMA0_9ACTN|nr:hypothetical protein [Streptomyces smaragdinus]MQY14597.1 hypothetical protein [Streptomyces smaragdinus]